MTSGWLLLCLVAAAPTSDEAAVLKTFRDEFVLITPVTGAYPAELTMTRDGASGNAASAEVVVRFAHSFYIAKYEVTQELWQAVMGANPSRWQGRRNSVELVDFNDAGEFCKRATARMIEARLIEPTQIVRLPSEAEWEYCARAGTNTDYSFGDDVKLLDRYAWHTGNAAGNDPAVGAKEANPWGLSDMHGYLWEWCGDVWTDSVADLPSDGTADTQGDPAYGVLRGGSWKDASDKLTSGFRLRAERTVRDDSVGLRCVLTK